MLGKHTAGEQAPPETPNGEARKLDALETGIGMEFGLVGRKRRSKLVDLIRCYSAMLAAAAPMKW